MALGFLVEKFDLFLQVAARSLGGRSPTPTNEAIGDVAGLLLIVLGAAMMVVAMVHQQLHDGLRNGSQEVVISGFGQ